MAANTLISALALEILFVCSSFSCGAQQTGAGIHAGQPFSIVEYGLTTAGISFRIDIPWRDVETVKGVLKFPDGDVKLDGLAAEAFQRKTPGIILLDYGNQFYGGGIGGTELPKSDSAIQGFANYAAFMVNHFKGTVTTFEVYNEWNANITSAVTPHVLGDAPSYVKLLKAVYPVIKSANPDAIVVGGAVAGTDTNWIKMFIAAGGLAYVDGFSVHPYVYKHAPLPLPPSDLKISWIAAAQAAEVAPIRGTPEESIAWLDLINGLTNKATTGKRIPIYVTEVGWPTYTTAFGVTETAAAAYVQRYMLLVRARPWIAGVWWYELIDGGTDSTNPEDRFGLLGVTGVAKPAFTSLREVDDFLASTSAVIQKPMSGGGIVVSGQKGPKDVCAVWLPTNDFAAFIPSTDLKTLSASGYTEAGATVSQFIVATPHFLSK